MKAYKGLKQGGKLKTTGNAKIEVKAHVGSAKIAGLPGLGGLHEATGVKKLKKIKPMGDSDKDGY